MGIANDLKELAMFGRFAPNSFVLLSVAILILQIVYSPALAKPRPQQFFNTKQWTGNVNDRHWSNVDSIGNHNSQRQKRRVSEQEDILKDQNGFKVLTASNNKREGIQTPIEPLQDSSVSNHGSNLRSNDGGSSGISGTARANIDNIPAQSRSGIAVTKPNEGAPSGSSVSSGNNDANGQKREEVSKSNEENKSNDKDKPQNNDKTSSNSKTQETQSNPNSVTISGNTVNGRPISSSSSEPVRDPLGNSGAEVVTSHPLFESRAQNERRPYAESRSDTEQGEGGAKESSNEPEVGHFQVDDKSADLEINANSAGVKVKAKPASLQVVSRPGAHPPTPIVPVAPINPFYHHHHFHPYYDGYRRSTRPYHRRYYNNPYHAHYRNWIPPPHFHRYWRHYNDDEPTYRRSYEHFRYPYHHHHHFHRFRDPESDLYDRSTMEDFEYPRYRRRFRGPFRRPMYESDFDTRFHIPRMPRMYVRHDIVTPMPPPVNVFGNPPPGILNGSPAARFFGASPFNALPNMGSPLPGMFGLGQGMMGAGYMGPAMGGPLMPGMFGPGMIGPEMSEPLGMSQGFGGQGNSEARSLLPRRVVKKTAIQGERKPTHNTTKSDHPKTKSNHTLAKILKKSHDAKSNASHSKTLHEAKHRSRRSADTEPKVKKSSKTLTHPRPQKKNEQKATRKNSIIIHRPPIIYHPPPEIYHRPDIVVHRAPIMLHRPAIIYHQPPVVVHRPAIIYHQPSIVFHQPPPMVHQPIMHSHDTYITRPMVLHSSSMLSHATNYLGIPNHVYTGDFDYGFHSFHGSHGGAFRKHAVPHKQENGKSEKRDEKKRETGAKRKSPSRHKRDIYAEYLNHLDSMSSAWAERLRRKRDLESLATKEASTEALTYKDVAIGKRDEISRVHDKESHNKREIDEDDINDNSNPRITHKRKKDVVVNRPPIIYHPPPEVYHRPDIVVHRPPLVIHRPPIIYHQPPVIVHRPAVVYHQPPIVFHQPPPAVSQPLLFSHDSFTVHPSFYATHHGSVVRDYGHYIGIPNIVSNYGAPLFHSAMGKRSRITKPKKGNKRTSKRSRLHKKKSKTESAHKKNSVVIRRPPIIYHPPPEIYHRPDIVVHRAPIMIRRAPIVYHQPPVVVHRPAIVYHQPSLVFHQPPPVVHQPMYQSHDTYVTHHVAVPYASHVTRHGSYVGVPNHTYFNYDRFHWASEDHEDRGVRHGDHAFYKSQVPKATSGSTRDSISKSKAQRKSLKNRKSTLEKPKKKNNVVIKRPPIIYHPPPEIFHRPDIVVHRPPILVHRAPIVYHQPPVIVHRPAIVYHQPNIVFHQPSPMVHQPIMRSHDTWVTRPVIKLFGSSVHHLGSVTTTPHAYFNGHHSTHYLAYEKSKVPVSSTKQEKAASRDSIKHSKETKGVDDGSGDASGDFVEFNDDDGSLVSGSGELDIEVVDSEPVKAKSTSAKSGSVKSKKGSVKSKLHKSKSRTEDASKKAEIPATNEKNVKGTKKNSVVIHRPPIIYHPPPEIYHRPDIVVHRAPIVLYRAPIIYHQPPVVVHRPAIVYHQPEIVFHQPPPVVNQPIMHAHDTYVTHSVVVPAGSHVSHVENYHGVPHEEIYMQGIGHGAFTKSVLPLRKGHKRDSIRKAEKQESTKDLRQPIGAGERIQRSIEESLGSDLGEDVNLVVKRSGLGLGVESSENTLESFDHITKRSINQTENSQNDTHGSKKTVIIIRRPPILYHPPSHVIHRPNIMYHRPPIVVHRHPLIIHRPPILVHRMPIVIHRPPVLIHRRPMVVHRPDLVFHRPPVLIHRVPYIVHPHPILIRRPPIVINKGPHMMVHHSSYIHHYPSHIIHMGCHGCGCHGGMCGKSKIPKNHKRDETSSHDTEENHKILSENFASDLKVDRQGIQDATGNYKFSAAPDSDPEGLSSFDFKISESPLKQTEGYARTNMNKRSAADGNKTEEKANKKKKKKDVVVSRPPIIYHPPPEVYHRPEIVVHRAPILIHRPPIVYHQPPVVVHRPAVVYHQPPIIFHQPPPAVNQPLLYSHDQYVLHPASVAQHINSVVNEGGHYIGLPHGGIENYPAPGPMAMHPFGHGLAAYAPGAGAGFKRTTVQRPEKKGNKKESEEDNSEGSSSGDSENGTKRSKAQKKKHTKGARKNNVLVYRPPMIYHPPPEIYDRPDIVVHRPDLVVHQPSIVYHQSSVVVHRPPIIYHQPPVVFHQPPPMVHQPIATSHDVYHAHQYFEPYSSTIHHTSYYTGAPHFFPGSNPYGWGVHAGEVHGPIDGPLPYVSHGPVEGPIPYGPHGPLADGFVPQGEPPVSPYGGPGLEPILPADAAHVGPGFGPYQPGFAPTEPDFGPYGPPLGATSPGPYDFNAPALSTAYGRSAVEKSTKKNKKGSKKSKNVHKKSKVRRRRSTSKNKKTHIKKKNKQTRKGDRKNVILVHRPPMIYHPPPEIYDRPDIVVHRPDLVFHRPSIVYHQSSVVIHRPPIIYHEPPVVFHQPPPMVHQPIAHSHDTYVAHNYYEPTGSHVAHAGHYVGAPHFFPAMPYESESPYGKSKITKSKTKKHSKHRSRRSIKEQKKSDTPSKKNNVLIMRPPLIYHPPPEIYDRPNVVVHRPDLVIHRPSIVYHMPSVVVHRPPIVYQQPPVVFHQPPPINTQPIVHAHDYYQSHIYNEPFASHIAHAGTYVGSPHHFNGGWGYGYSSRGNWAPAFAKSIVPKGNATKKTKRSVALTKKKAKRSKKGQKKNLVVAHRPDMIYHPPPEIYDRPNIVVHRPDIVVHQPSIVYHQSSVVVHRPPIVYNQPPLVFHQPPPMVHQPVLHSHDTYIGHQYYEPHGSVVSHAGSYVGAPHFYGGGFGYGYGTSGPVIAKSKVAKSSKKTAKGKKRPKRSSGDKTNVKKSKSKVTEGHKKNLVVMRRPSVVYHPPPEIYHRPDVILHRPDIVIHRPSVVFHQSAVVVHRPPVVYHQPPLVFHQPPPMVHQPIMHSHETYLAHHYFEPHHTHVTHAGTYVGAPHFFHGGWGYGYGYHHGPGHAFGKSKVEQNDSKKSTNKDEDKEEKEDDKYNDDDDDNDEEDDDDDEVVDAKKPKPTKTKRSTKSHSKSKKKAVHGHKKNVVVMHRPPVVYHPPPEVYHRPDVVLHRPDIVIHRPSVVFHQAPVLLHRPAVVYHQPPIVFHQPSPMVHQPILHSHEAYLPHHYFEPHHSHMVHAGTYVGAPHFFGGGWGFGYGHAFGKSKVEKNVKKRKHHKSKRDINKDNVYSKLFGRFRTKRSAKKAHAKPKKAVKASKKNLVLINRPPMIYHPPPEIYDRPNIVVHRPDLVYHQPAVVYHQSSVVVHRAPIIYHPPPVVFHQPPPFVHQNVLHSHDTYIARQYFEPSASGINGGQSYVHGHTYVGAPHFFTGGWGYGYGFNGHAPVPHPYGPWNGYGPGYGPRPPFPYPNEFHGPVPYGGAVPAGPVPGPAFAKSNVEGSHKPKLKKKIRHHRDKRNIDKDHPAKKSRRIKSKERHHRGHKKQLVVNRPPIVFHQAPEVYHRPDVVFHRPDVLIHRPPIIMHQAPVVVHKPAIVYHQPPIVLHQSPPVVHQPVIYAHDAYVPPPLVAPVGYAAVPATLPYGYSHVVGGYGKSRVEKVKSKKRHKKVTQVKASKKGDILHAEEEKTARAVKKNDIVVSRPPIIYHPPPEVYHRPDIVVHRAPIVLHRPPIIYHQPPVVVHRPAVVYHQPPIVFHQPPPAVHQPILHSHDTFVVHHGAMYEPRGSTVSHQTNYIGIPSHVEQYDEGVAYEEGHNYHDDDFHDDHESYHGGYHGGYHDGFHGRGRGLHGHRRKYSMHYRSDIEHAKKPSSNEGSSEGSSEVDEESQSNETKTMTRRQVLGSHSLFLPDTPLDLFHPKGPLNDRLQKMSTIPHPGDSRPKRQVSEKDVEPKRRKRQIEHIDEQTLQNLANANSQVRQLEAFEQPQGPVFQDPRFFDPRMAYFQPQYPFLGRMPFKRPEVRVHVETQRSKIPKDDKKKKQKRQVFPYMQPLINEQHLPLMRPQYLGFQPLHPVMMTYPYTNFAPKRPRVNINVQSARSKIPKQLKKKGAKGGLFHYKRPKVSVDVHTSKSDIPGSNGGNIFVRARRQLLNYLPVSPLTTGGYHFSGLKKTLAPLKRSKVAQKNKRSTKKSKIKANGEERNTKRDEFTQQARGDNVIHMNPDNPAPLPFGNGAQNAQLLAGAEGLNVLGPGGLNGAAAEPQLDQPQQQPAFFNGNTGDEQRVMNGNENVPDLAQPQQDLVQPQPQGEIPPQQQEELVQPQQDQPQMPVEEPNFQISAPQAPSFTPLQDLQGVNRMVVPENELSTVNQAPPFMSPSAPFLSPAMPGPLFPAQPIMLRPPLIRPFVPFGPQQAFVPQQPLPLPQPFVAQQPFPLRSAFQPVMPPLAPTYQPSINVNINTAKSNLPGLKAKKTEKPAKVVSRTIPGKEKSKAPTNKRQQISLFQRMPAMQVLPQRFLQDGVQIPSFTRQAAPKIARHHEENEIIVTELRRKHGIPKNASNKAAHKRQFFHVPVQTLQPVQPLAAPFSPLFVPRQPKVNVQVNIAKKKSNVKMENKYETNKVKRQIYGMNELPRGLEFSDDKANASVNKENTKKFKIRSEDDSYSDGKRTAQKRDAEERKKSSKKEDKAKKRQFVSPYGRRHGYFEPNVDEPEFDETPEEIPPVIHHTEHVPFAHHVVASEPLVPHVLPAPIQPAVIPVQAPIQPALIPVQQPLVQAPNPFYGNQPQVNVNVQVAKKSDSDPPKSDKAKTFTKRQFFGTVPLLAAPVLANVNAIAKPGVERSSVPVREPSVKEKRQMVGVAQPLLMAQPGLTRPYGIASPMRPRVSVNVQTARSNIHRNKRQLYDILSGKRAQVKLKDEVDLSRRSVSKHIKNGKSERSVPKEKRQLADLINNILQRRGGPKLLQNILKRQQKPSVMFTTNNDNDQKPVEIFGGNTPVDRYVEGGQPRPNNGGDGTVDITPAPPQNVFGGNNAMEPAIQDDQAAINAQGQVQAPLVRPEEPNQRTNLLPFLQNPVTANALTQQQAQRRAEQQVEQQAEQTQQQFSNGEKRMPQPPLPRVFLTPQLPQPISPPFLRRTPTVFVDRRPFAPIPQPALPQVAPFRPQYPVVPQFPPMFPMMPQMPPPEFPYYPMMFPPMGPNSDMVAPLGQNDDDDRPSVSVNVETSRSKIQNSKKTKKT